VFEGLQGAVVGRWGTVGRRWEWLREGRAPLSSRETNSLERAQGKMAPHLHRPQRSEKHWPRTQSGKPSLQSSKRLALAMNSTESSKRLRG